MLKVDGEQDQVVVAKAYRAEQEHVFRFWSQLTPEQQRALLDQLAEVDFQHMARLVKLIDEQKPAREQLAPLVPLAPSPERRAELASKGWEALNQGQVACLMVAGGQGTRLGWPGPKGTYAVGPVSGKSLYQLFAEQVLALSKRAGKPIHWYVLTSRLNREATEAFFAEHDLFGLLPGQVEFLVQRDLPSVDARGKLILAGVDQIATSPNGHGGTLQALREAGALEAMAERGNEYLFYWQVDNPLCQVADPAFLGALIEGEAEAGTKVVKKTEPTEKIGLLGLFEDKTTVIEYSEMSEEQQEAREDSGDLLYRAGNTAIHLFRRSFLQRLGEAGFELEVHLAKKTVPHVDSAGDPVEPSEPNGIKFETFIFDILGEASGHVALEVERASEFEPLKNADGPYSPATVKAAQSDRARAWLAEAGYPMAQGVTCEISALTALDPSALGEALSAAPTPKDGALLL